MQSISSCGPVLAGAAGTRVQQGPVRGLQSAGPAPAQSLLNTVQPYTSCSPAPLLALHPLQPQLISVLYLLQRHTSFSPTLQADPSLRSLRCAVCSVHCSVCRVQCAGFIAQCAACSALQCSAALCSALQARPVSPARGRRTRHLPDSHWPDRPGQSWLAWPGPGLMA